MRSQEQLHRYASSRRSPFGFNPTLSLEQDPTLATTVRLYQSLAAMSSSSSAEIAQVIALLSDINTANYCVVAIIALLTYEWIITLAYEVDLFWRDKFSIATVLFLLNRYTPIVYIAASFAGDSAKTDASCNASVLASIALVMLQYVPWSLFSTLRVYAICEKRWYLAAPVLLFSGFPIVLNLLHYHWEHGEMVPMFGCQSVFTVPPRLATIFTIVSRSSLILGDAFVVIATWMTTYSATRRDGIHMRTPTFSNLLLVNGTIYFVVLTIMNTLQLVFTMLSIAVSFSESSYIISFTEPITAILVSRFLFSLQNVKKQSQHQHSLNSFEVSSVDFGGVLGAIESTLQPEDVLPSNGEVPGEKLSIGTEHVLDDVRQVMLDMDLPEKSC